MKYKSLFMSALLAFSVSACINDAEVLGPDAPDNNTPVQAGAGRMTIQFAVPNPVGTRATAEDSGDHLQGTKKEYELKTVRLYLFNETTGNITNSFDLDDLQIVEENRSDLYVIYGAKEIQLNPGKYRILAVANATNLPSSPATIQSLLGYIDNQTYTSTVSTVPDNGIVMTNRGAQAPVVTITTDNHSSATITLERVLAKVLVSTAEDSFNLKDKDGNTYVTIKPANYGFVNVNKCFYLFRHVAELADADETPAAITDWTNPTNFTTIPDVDGYAIDPHFFEKTVADAATFDGSAIFANYLAGYADPYAAGTKQLFTSTLPAVGTKAPTYCLGNTMFRPAQKHVYTTGLMFKCNVSVPEGRCFDENGDNVSSDNQDEVFYFNYNFYTSLEAVKLIGGANVPAAGATDAELATYGIKHFKNDGGFNCYYNYWIKHLDNKRPTVMGVMEFGVVRNNIYDVKIADILGLGDATPDVRPETPDEQKGYLDVDFEVMPWINRTQNVNLE